MSGDVHVRFCEGLGVRFPWATRLIGTLSPAQMNKLDQALSIALGLDKYPS